MQIAVLGPRRSGKTCFLYLMLHKLRAAKLDKVKLSGFKDRGTHNGVRDSVMRNKWPQPNLHMGGDTSGYTPPHEVEFRFEGNGFMGGRHSLVIPERSGILFETYSNIHLNDKNDLEENEKRAAKECSHLIERCHGIILVLDMENINNEESAAHGSHYANFVNNIRQKHNRVFRRSPILVLLNKSDVIKDGSHEMYGMGGARDYLMSEGHLSHIVGEVEADAQGDVLWAWHSTTSGVVKDSEGVLMPDYKKYYSVDADTYAGAFMQFIGLINRTVK